MFIEVSCTNNILKKMFLVAATFEGLGVLFQFCNLVRVRGSKFLISNLKWFRKIIAYVNLNSESVTSQVLLSYGKPIMFWEEGAKNHPQSIRSSSWKGSCYFCYGEKISKFLNRDLLQLNTNLNSLNYPLRRSFLKWMKSWKPSTAKLL